MSEPGMQGQPLPDYRPLDICDENFLQIVKPVDTVDPE